MIFHPVLDEIREYIAMGLMNGDPADRAKSWRCVLDVAPTGKGRPRFTKTGRTYTPEKTLNKESEIRYALSMLDAPLFSGPVEVVIKTFFIKPKSAKKRVHHTVKPDASNILKLVEDAANGILYDDDKQIVKCTISKEYGETERIEIEIREIEC